MKGTLIAAVLIGILALALLIQVGSFFPSRTKQQKANPTKALPSGSGSTGYDGSTDDPQEAMLTPQHVERPRSSVLLNDDEEGMAAEGISDEDFEQRLKMIVPEPSLIVMDEKDFRELLDQIAAPVIQLGPMTEKELTQRCIAQTALLDQPLDQLLNRCY